MGEKTLTFLSAKQCLGKKINTIHTHQLLHHAIFNFPKIENITESNIHIQGSVMAALKELSVRKLFLSFQAWKKHWNVHVCAKSE
jgi:hypothetical protein